MGNLTEIKKILDSSRSYQRIQQIRLRNSWTKSRTLLLSNFLLLQNEFMASLGECYVAFFLYFLNYSNVLENKENKKKLFLKKNKKFQIMNSFNIQSGISWYIAAIYMIWLAHKLKNNQKKRLFNTMHCRNKICLVLNAMSWIGLYTKKHF